MFEWLAPFPRILVTGPQRSGTTIAAAMIASDLGLKFYPEERIVLCERWRVDYVMERRGFVLQCPAFCRYVHEYTAPDVAIVLMRRAIEDIIASEERINWESQKQELRRYGLQEGVISQVKYDYWEQHQKTVIHNPFEVEYESLAGHPMWIPKTQRSNFGPRQYTHDASSS